MQASPPRPDVKQYRKWSEAEKTRFLDEALQPGETVASVADKHGISRGLLYRWMARARAVRLATDKSSGRTSPASLRLAHGEESFSEPIPVPDSATQAALSFIEVALHNGRILKARENIDPDLLAKLVDALDKPKA